MTVLRKQTSTYPNRFSRDRCLLLTRFLIVLAFGATLFQMAMLVLFYRPSHLLIISALFVLSILVLFGAYVDLRRILKLRAEAKKKALT